MDQRQAADAIKNIETTQQRTQTLRHYRDYGSVIMAWGVAWLVGFMTQQFAPDAAWLAWGAAWIGALGWTLTRPAGKSDQKALATWIICNACISLLLVLIEADFRTIAAVFAIGLTAAYAVMGVWAGRRFLALAALVLVSLLIGWWVVPDALFFALALGGGAGLVLGGLWLRQP